jgi:hypothetical protein
MELQIGDRLADETGEYEVIGRPYTPGALEDRERVGPESRPTGGHGDPELAPHTSASR